MRKKKLRVYAIVWRNSKNEPPDQIVSTHENRIFATAKCERLNTVFRADIRSAIYGLDKSAGFYLQQRLRPSANRLNSSHPDRNTEVAHSEVVHFIFGCPGYDQ